MATVSVLRVPPGYQDALRKFAHLPAEEATAVVEVARVPGFSSPSVLEANFGEVLPTWSKSDIERLVGALFNLSSLHATHGWGIEEIVDELATRDDLELEPEFRSTFTRNLSELLYQPGLASLAKAVDVASEYDNILHTSRVITDVRPVFGDDATAMPTAAVVSHTLRLDYYEQRSGIKTFSAVLSEEDLRSLSLVLDRALEKSAAVSALLSNSGVMRISMEEE